MRQGRTVDGLNRYFRPLSEPRGRLGEAHLPHLAGNTIRGMFEQPRSVDTSVARLNFGHPPSDA